MIGYDPDRHASQQALIERIRLSIRGTQSGQAHDCMEDLAAGSPPNNLLNEGARLVRKCASEQTCVGQKVSLAARPSTTLPPEVRRLTPGY
ncbi:hypothetical protein PHISCL_07369 [Aspergillus sclerotialis]|uniref:Uncharacterized protein n=1 Tax=Aspergillus sclerotialis TaxID=2070753 RepID=A0A3A2ZLR1_9EURO|nr:hypothetical protein PHISCL_07369 [Aspergillus sclerotialis]